MIPDDIRTSLTPRGATLAVLYLGVSLFVNLTISWWPPQNLLGVELPPGLLLVGLIFVVRDYTQREIGAGVIGLTLVAALLTYFFIGERIGLASGLAFIVSEGLDQLIYSRTNRPMKSRILISSIVSIPFDGMIFLGLMGWLTTELFLVHYALKMIASLLMWVWLNSRPNPPSNPTSLAPAE